MAFCILCFLWAQVAFCYCLYWMCWTGVPMYLVLIWKQTNTQFCGMYPSPLVKIWPSFSPLGVISGVWAFHEHSQIQQKKVNPLPKPQLNQSGFYQMKAKAMKGEEYVCSSTRAESWGERYEQLPSERRDERTRLLSQQESWHVYSL